MKHLLAALVTLLAVLPREQDLVLGAEAPCPRRYLRRINGKCYYFSVTKMNWFGALNNCLRKGLTLADLSNPRDFDGAVGFLASLGNTEDFWFGGNDLYHEGRFTYISNGRLVRYYSNFSDVLPAEQSECDDCLEVRVRAHVNMVAADNCLERQYFICSERYCEPGCGDDDAAKGKKKHHSHEHLHHFHHDIGDSNEADEEDIFRGHSKMLPIASGSKEQADNSEVAIDGADAPDAGDLNDGSSTTTSPEGGQSTTSGDATTAAGADNTTPKQEETTAAAGGDNTTPKQEETTAAAGGDITTPKQEETTAAAGGDITTPKQE
ncbi:hypothetical protein KR054_001491, partial [Drosophila jambulina]